LVRFVEAVLNPVLSRVKKNLNYFFSPSNLASQTPRDAAPRCRSNSAHDSAGIETERVITVRPVAGRPGPLRSAVMAFVMPYPSR
jgi:hypothetical protein